MRTPELRAMIVDSHPLVRRGLRSLLGEDPAIRVVAEAATGVEAARGAAEHTPDAAVVGSHLGGGGCLEAVRALARSGQPVPTLVVGEVPGSILLRALLDAGAAGYLLSDEPATRLVEALRGAARGEPGWISRRATAVLRHAWRDPLTPQELEVVRLLAEGRAAPEVADLLGLSARTARNHLCNVYCKLGVHSQPALVAWAWRSGLAGAG